MCVFIVRCKLNLHFPGVKNSYIQHVCFCFSAHQDHWWLSLWSREMRKMVCQSVSSWRMQDSTESEKMVHDSLDPTLSSMSLPRGGRSSTDRSPASWNRPNRTSLMLVRSLKWRWSLHRGIIRLWCWDRTWWGDRRSSVSWKRWGLRMTPEGKRWRSGTNGYFTLRLVLVLVDVLLLLLAMVFWWH